MEFTNSQWGAQFGNTTVGAAFANLGTVTTPIQVLSDAIEAYNKAETSFNDSRTAPPYLNSVATPSTGTIIFGAGGEPIQPVTYQVSVQKSFATATIVPQTSPVII